MGAIAARYERIDRRYLAGCVQRDRRLQQVVSFATSRAAFGLSVACYKSSGRRYFAGCVGCDRRLIQAPLACYRQSVCRYVLGSFW